MVKKIIKSDFRIKPTETPSKITPIATLPTPEVVSTLSSGKQIDVQPGAESKVASSMLGRDNLTSGTNGASGVPKLTVKPTPQITAPTPITTPTTPTLPTQPTPATPTQDTTLLEQGVASGKYTKNSAGEYLDAKTGIKVTPTTPTDVLNSDNIPAEYKSFYDTLTDAEKKQFTALGEQSQKAGQNIVEGYANYMRDYNTTKTRAEQDRETQLKSQAIQTEMGDIQSSQTLRKARAQVDKLIQSVGYLGTQGMPGVSQARLTGVQNQIGESEKTYTELVKLQQLADSARAAGYADMAVKYERQMEDLNTQLNDNIDKSIQEAYNSLVSSDQNGQLDTVKEIEAFRLKMLNDLDSKITGITDASIAQRQFLIQRYDKIVEDAKTFEANKNTINNDMSKVKGFYVDGNGNPVISATTATPIQIPHDAPIDPIYDKRNGTVVSFTKDADGNITAKVDKVMDSPTFETQTLSNYAKLVANGKMNLGDLQELGLPDALIQKVMSESASIKPTIKAPDVQVIGKDENGNDIRGIWNETTNQYEPITIDNMGVMDFSNNQTIINKYPYEASFKNNNPTGITWNANFDSKQGLAKLLDDAGVKYEKGTPRPSAEGGNYVKFATVQDGLNAYMIALTQRGDDVNTRLQQWVGTSEGPTYAKNLMEQAGIPMGAKFSELSEDQLSKLMDAQLRKESPNFHKELSGIQQGEGYNTEQQIYDAIFQNSGGASKVSGEEGKVMKQRAKEFARQGLTPQEAVMKYKGLNVSGDDANTALDYINIGDNLGKDKPNNYETTVAKYINSGDMQGLNTYVNRLADQNVLSLYKTDAVLSGDFQTGLNRANEITNLIDKNRDKIGAFDGRVSDLIQKFADTPDYQKMKTLLQMSQADMRKYFAGSAVTETEMKALQDFIGGTTKMNPDNLITMLNTLTQDRQMVYNEQRQGLIPPELSKSETTPTIQQPEFDYKNYLPENAKSTGAGSTSEITTPSGFKYTPTNSLSDDLKEVFN